MPITLCQNQAYLYFNQNIFLQILLNHRNFLQNINNKKRRYYIKKKFFIKVVSIKNYFVKELQEKSICFETKYKKKIIKNCKKISIDVFAVSSNATG